MSMATNDETYALYVNALTLCKAMAAYYSFSREEMKLFPHTIVRTFEFKLCAILRNEHYICYRCGVQVRTNFDYLYLLIFRYFKCLVGRILTKEG